ncbi:MAG: WYL domain-containing protein [Nanoarchaeota archaeon]
MENRKRAVQIIYTNYRGETSERTIIPVELIFGKNEWHPQEQWMIRAIDVEKGAVRTFTLKDIKSWNPI